MSKINEIDLNWGIQSAEPDHTTLSAMPSEDVIKSEMRSWAKIYKPHTDKEGMKYRFTGEIEGIEPSYQLPLRAGGPKTLKFPQPKYCKYLKASLLCLVIVILATGIAYCLL